MYGATVPLSDLETVAHAAAVRSPTCRYVRLAVAALLALTGTLAAALSLAPPAGARPPSPSVWQASYADQLHPGCERKISIEKNGDRVIAHFAGTDVGPKGIGDKVFLACSPDNVEKYKLRTWAFDGEIVGDRIDAGDGVHAGTWNVNFKGAENPWTGIRWKDGNRWLKLEEE